MAHDDFEEMVHDDGGGIFDTTAREFGGLSTLGGNPDSGRARGGIEPLAALRDVRKSSRDNCQ